MGLLSVGESVPVLRSSGLTGIEISAVMLLVSSLVFNFYREKDSRLTEFLLSHFSRPDYISGKLCGYLLIGLFYITLAGLGWSLVLVLNGAFSFQVIPALFVLYLKTSIITAVALVLSCLFGSYTMAFFSTLFVYIASEVSRDALKIVASSQLTWLKPVFKGIYYLLPNMDKLDIKSAVVFDNPLGPGYFGWVGLYAVIYILLLWALATYIFLKKEI
jgi:ABC-type transport system involved in multi-copper enzyme maturation permease subunit